MKPIQTRTVEIYYYGVVLSLEIEEYKTLYHVHFVDHRKYFSHLHTITFKKYKGFSFTEMVNHCREYAITKHYF